MRPCSWLESSGPDFFFPLAPLARLTNLSRLLLCRGFWEGEEPIAAIDDAWPALALPGGDWLAGIEHLAASPDILVASIAAPEERALEQMSLQHLSLLRLQCADAGFFAAWGAEWRQLVDWIVAHEPLDSVLLVCKGSHHVRVTDAILSLHQRRPQLLIDRADEPYL